MNPPQAKKKWKESRKEKQSRGRDPRTPLTHHSPVIVAPSVTGDGEPGGLTAVVAVALGPRLLRHEAAVPVVVAEGLHAAAAASAPPARWSVQPAKQRRGRWGNHVVGLINHALHVHRNDLSYGWANLGEAFRGCLGQ